MFASKYARYLPEVGEPINYRVRLIERLEHERALALMQADALQAEIAAEEMDLESEISKTWKRREITAAQKAARSE